MKGGGERERSGLWPRPGWVEAERAMAPFLPPSSFFSISFSRLVKNFTSRNFIFPFHPTPAFRFAAALYPPLPRYNRYVPITFSFCLQKSSVSGMMEDRINCLCVGKRLQKYLHGRMKKSGYKNVYIEESFFAYVGKSILRPQANHHSLFFSLSSISFLYRSKNFFKL